MKKIISYFVNKSLIVNIISIGLLLGGLLFLTGARREAFPNIEFDWVKVTTVYPGATAKDVEKHVTISIEDELREIDGIETLNSRSMEGMSYITIKLDPDLPDKDKTISDIKNAIDRVSDLPEDARDPEVVELDMKQQPVINISLFNKNGIDNDEEEFELREYAKILEDRLLELDGTAKISKTGYRDREMIVQADPALLDKYHVAMNDLIYALSKKNLNFPGGTIYDSGEKILLRTEGEVESPREIADVLIRANMRAYNTGNWIKIGDVAGVKDSFEKADIINKTSGVRSVTLTVLKKQSADIIDLIDNIENEIGSFRNILPGYYNIIKTNDLSFYVERRLNVLKNNGIIGFALVIIVLFSILGWRIALVTALGLPLAFSATFIWMGYAGVSINLMSMFGLIMVLGMLVDDAIIVAENIYRHIEEGTELKDAVISGTFQVVTPVAGTILTTIAAFGPLMFMSGIMGKFIWTLPAVVSVALIASWMESMFILPSHVKDIEKYGAGSAVNRKRKKRDPLKLFREKYYIVLKAVLTHRYIGLAAVILLLAGTAVFGVFNVKFILFPGGRIEIFMIRAEAKAGTPLEEMNEKLSLIEKEVLKLPESELKSFTAKAGIIQENANDPFKKIGSRYGMVTVNLTPDDERERTTDEIIESLKEKCDKLSAFEKITFRRTRQGPPVGKAVNVTIKGGSFATLKKIAGEYKEYLSEIDGLKDIKDNFEEKKKELKIRVNEKLAAITGITVFDVASTVRACYEGNIATTIKKSEEEIDVRVIFPEAVRKNINSLKEIKIANRRGNLIPLKKVAEFKKTEGISVINREDWKRSLTVSAEIEEDAEETTSVGVNTMMMKDFADIGDRYKGYAVSYEGEFEDTQESIKNLSDSFKIALIFIYIILVSLFSSLIHPFVIIAVIPFTFTGIIWTFFFHGLPFSFISLMGIVGLAGVVINDSIVFVDFINKEIDQGSGLMDSILQAGMNRLRPIFLTTVTTFFGLLPTAYGIGGDDEFLKPMALAMSWGLVFGTVIILFITPVLYYVFTDIKTFAARRFS